MVPDVIAGDYIKTSEYNNLRAEAPQPGMVAMWGTITVPSGWILCNGQSLSTTTYADLFAVVGYTFGGAGASFNVPDVRDRSVVGSQSTYATASTGGGTFTLTEANVPAHTHTISATSAHRHQVGITQSAGTTIYIVNRTTNGGVTAYLYTGYAGDHNHGGATPSEGSGTATAFVHSYLALNFMMKY